MSSALDTQVGGGHYKGMKIQVVEFVHANGLDGFQMNVIKYVCRHKNKNKLEDLKKALHYIQLYMELEYGKELKKEAIKQAEEEKKEVKRLKAKATREKRKALMSAPGILSKTVKKVPKKVSSFMKPVYYSLAVGEVIGSNKPDKLSRADIVKYIWAYIKKNNLQDAKNKRMINCDEKMKVIMGGKDKVSMFEMTDLLSNHLHQNPTTSR